MQRLQPCLWFDDNAEQAVDFYTSVFANSSIGTVARYGKSGAKASGRAEGSVMTIAFQISGHSFLALNGGPMFKFSPAVSFVVPCETEDEIDALFEKLSQNGQVLMELAKYPFSEKFGWLIDGFGVSWQLTLTNRTKAIAPSLMFVDSVHGKAEEAMNFYTSVFPNSKIIHVEKHDAGEQEPEGTVRIGIFQLDGCQFRVIDSALQHSFGFTPAISFMVNCSSQEEIDSYWARLGESGQIQQCGWLSDKFGVSWQVVPVALEQIMKSSGEAEQEKVMSALMKMVKIDIDGLKQAQVSVAH